MFEEGDTDMARLTRIAPELPTANLGAAIEYYEQRLGFHTAMRMPAGDYAIVERDGVAIHLFEANGSTPTPAAIHIFTSDLDEVFAELERKGVRFTQRIVSKPWGNRDFRLKDHFGNELKFTEPLPGEERGKAGAIAG
jgi:uncharacterized glyoxalase superfamily protein PhnB